MLVKDWYMILKNNGMKVNNFLERLEFCFVNEDINLLIEHNNNLFDEEKENIISIIHEKAVEGEMFYIHEKNERIYIIACENEMELKQIIEENKYNDEIRNRFICKYGLFTKISDRKEKSEVKMKEVFMVKK